MEPTQLTILKNRIVLSDVIDPYVHLQTKGENHWGCCPFHEEKTPSFKVSNSHGRYYCFGCHKQGDAFDFLMEKKGLSFTDACEELGLRYGIAVKHTPSTPPRKNHEDLKAILHTAARFFCQTLTSEKGVKAREYLAARGFDTPQHRTLVKTFGLGMTDPSPHALRLFIDKQHQLSVSSSNKKLFDVGLITEKGHKTRDRFWDRLIFPLRNLAGEVIGFGGRSLSQTSTVKYLNSPETLFFSKQHYLYGLYEARQNKSLSHAPVVLTEGYFDVIALQQAGLARATAPLGTAISIHQLSLLFRESSEVLICFDGDAAGQKAAQRLSIEALPLLQTNRRLKFAHLPRAEDPHSLLAKNQHALLKKAFDTAGTLEDMLYKNIQHTCDLKTPEGKATAQHLIHTWQKKITDNALAYQYQRALKNRLYHQKAERAQTKAPSIPKPQTAEMMREKALIATFINHPELIDRHAEALAALELSPLGRTLQKALLGLLSSERLVRAATDLKKALTQDEDYLFQGLLQEEALYHYAPFAKPEAPLKKAETGLLDLLKRFGQNKELLKEIRAARESFLRYKRNDDWLRLRALREQTCG